MTNTLKIAIEGCGHGTLDQIYKSLENHQVDLLIICGDFQSIRNEADLKCINVPSKYLKMGDFQKYYSEKKKAPILTIFIGGNHEASNYLTELKFGGWVCPNIYYLGDSGVIWYKGLKIMGLSRIWNINHFNKPKYEKLPYDRSTIRSVYHIRNEDYLKLLLTNNLNNKSIMLSHDWPEGICNYDQNSLRYLLNKKPFFKSDIAKGELGSPVNRELLKLIKPRYWFAAHLHVYFNLKIDWEKMMSNTPEKSEIVKNQDEIELDIDSLSDIDDTQKNEDEIELALDDLSDDDQKGNKNSDEIKLDISDDENTESTPEIEIPSLEEHLNPTEFIALDKCLPRRKFIEFVEIPITSTDHISYQNQSVDLPGTMYQDTEFLAISKVIETKKQIIFSSLKTIEEVLYPSETLLQELKLEISKELNSLTSKIESPDFLKINPHSYVQTASPSETVVKTIENPQTIAFVNKYLS